MKLQGILFDGVIIDCTDCTLDGSVSATLFTEEFFRNMGDVMTEDATLS